MAEIYITFFRHVLVHRLQAKQSLTAVDTLWFVDTLSLIRCRSTRETSVFVNHTRLYKRFGVRRCIAIEKRNSHELWVFVIGMKCHLAKYFAILRVVYRSIPNVQPMTYACIYPSHRAHVCARLDWPGRVLHNWQIQSDAERRRNVPSP